MCRAAIVVVTLLVFHILVAAIAVAVYK